MTLHNHDVMAAQINDLARNKAPHIVDEFAAGYSSKRRQNQLLAVWFFGVSRR
jgi:hypothetical protein